MLNIVGDINLTDAYFNRGIGVGSSIAKGNDPFAKIERKEEDVWIGNFEGVSSSVSDNSGMEAEMFNIAPEYLKKLRHLDVYNIANNHCMEHGAEAFKETVGNLQKLGCQVFGLASTPSCIFSHRGTKCSVTGFCQRMEVTHNKPLYWYNPGLNDIEKEFETVANNDLKIIYIHWGNEFIDRPYNDQRLFAHALIDIGFDLVVGMHPHLLQGYEIYKGKRIYYSIGNFVFDMGWEPLRYGAMVHLDWNEQNELVVNHSYVHIEKDYFPVVVDEKEVPEAHRFNYLNSLIKYDMNNEEYYSFLAVRTKLYHKYNRRHILKSFLKMNPKDSLSIISSFILRKL